MTAFSVPNIIYFLLVFLIHNTQQRVVPAEMPTMIDDIKQENATIQLPRGWEHFNFSDWKSRSDESVEGILKYRDHLENLFTSPPKDPAADDDFYNDNVIFYTTWDNVYTSWWFWPILVGSMSVSTTGGFCYYKKRRAGVVIRDPSAITTVVTTTGQPGPSPITGGYDNMGIKPNASPGSPVEKPTTQPQPPYQPPSDGHAYLGDMAPPPAYSPN